MTAVHCLRAEFLIERRSAGLSAAEGLLLEEHLAGCERCGRQARLLFGLRALSNADETELPVRARERAIAAALAEAASGRTATRVKETWPRPALLGLAFAAAVALGFGLSFLRATHEQRAAARVARPSAPSGDRVQSGRVERAGQSLGAGTELATADVLRVQEHATLVLAHATVELEAGTEARWHAAERVLELRVGGVVAEVDPSLQRSFVVRTPRFSVEVLGTHFGVTLERVDVTRGRVRVVSPEGHPLATLAAGEHFELTDPASPSTNLPLPLPLAAHPPAPTAHPPAPAHPLTLAPASPPAPAATLVPAAASPAALLAEARAELAARHLPQARAKIDAALASNPTRSLHAEALSLRADCAIVAGDLGAAVEAYLRVARSFGELPAGENALFAAARLESDRGQSAAAAQQFEQYLARYPHGRFVKEANARLRTLESVLDRSP